MPLSSPSKQERNMIAVAETVEAIPMAENGQLQWVKRPLSSLSVLASSENAPSATSDVDSDEEARAMWWPSLLFNDYDDFQDFFEDEFDNPDGKNLEASETMALIMPRIFQNMLQQKTIMVARLLGRSIKEYVEIVELPEADNDAGDEGRSDAHGSVEPHQSTEFVSFHRMPQEVHIPQTKPEAFVFISSNTTNDESNEAIAIIDDDLYMSYLFALDLATTKRMLGPNAANDTLRSDFRDMGRQCLEKLPPSVQRLSEISNSSSDANASVFPTANDETPKHQESVDNDDGSEEDSSDSSDSDEETEDKIQSENIVVQEADTIEKVPREESCSPELSQEEGKDLAEQVTDTVKLSETKVEEATIEAEYCYPEFSEEEVNDLAEEGIGMVKLSETQEAADEAESCSLELSQEKEKNPAGEAVDPVKPSEMQEAADEAESCSPELSQEKEKLSETKVEATDKANVTEETEVTMPSPTETEASKENVACASTPDSESLLLSDTDAGTANPSANSHVDKSISGEKESKESVDCNGHSAKQESLSATVIAHSSEGPEVTDNVAMSLVASPTRTKTPIKFSPSRKSPRRHSPKKIVDLPVTNPDSPKRKLSTTPKKKLGRPRKTAGSPPPSPMKAKLGRPKKTADLPPPSPMKAKLGRPRKAAGLFPPSPKKAKLGRPKNTAGSPLPSPKKATLGRPRKATSSPSPSPKKAKRAYSPKNIADSPVTTIEKEDARTESFSNSPVAAPTFFPSPKKRSRLPKEVDTLEVTNKEVEKYATVGNTKLTSPATSPTASSFITPARIDQSLVNPETRATANLLEMTNGQGSEVGTHRGDATVSETSSPPCSPKTHVISIAKTPSPQKPINLDDDPGIKSNDDFAEVCQKLQAFGWTINIYEHTFFSPTVGYHHIKMNPSWRGKKFFLGKEDFLVFLRDTYGWTENDTSTPKQMKKCGGRIAVTPTSSGRMKRCRRSLSMGSEFNFKSKDEEMFYHFPNLIQKLKSCGWGYLPGKLKSYNYVLPECKKESKGGKYLEDFFYEESEVIQYCMNQKYYEKRKELGLMD